MPKKLLVVAMVAAVSVLAFAVRPTTIVGTWVGFANQTAVQLVITAQGTIGTCRAITGTFSNIPSGGASRIQGFYCPATGRIGFARKNVTTNDTFQFYSANVSDTGTTLRISGTFSELNLVGQLGEYNFAVAK